MNVCIIGEGLVSLSLAKALINNNFKVFIYVKSRSILSSLNRTIGITSSNMEFFQKEILKIKKNLFWNIYDIDIYNEKNKQIKILNFNDENKILFSMVQNKNLIYLLNKELKKNKNFKKIIIKKKSLYKKILSNQKYDLVINCEENNEIYKKYFFRKIVKNYKSTAYVSLINHKRINNKKAMQIFTKKGPLAFLPISKKQTSVVYSIKNKSINNNFLSQSEFEKLIFKFNKNYKITSIDKFETFFLKSKILKNYYKNNILAFGDLLHQIHPLSGQGFNMTLRDIRIFLKLIKDRKNLGLSIDSSILKEFENKTKHLNFVFSMSNDFIYEFFNYDNFYSKSFSNKIFYYLQNNKLFNKLAVKYANQGLVF